MADKKGAEFSAEENAAMKQRAAELRAEKAAQKAADKAQALEQACLDAIEALTGDDRANAETLHRLVKEHAPQWGAKTWYGFPSYTDADGKVVMFYQPMSKFGTRYGTLGFNDAAHLDDGAVWPTSYAITEIAAEDEPRIGELIRRAAG